MPVYAYIPLIIIVPIFIFGVVITVKSLKNVKQHLTYDTDYHRIEVLISFRTASLLVDGKTVDEIVSYQMTTAKLTATVDDLNIVRT